MTKKLLAIILTTVVSAGMILPAYASEVNEGNITIEEYAEAEVDTVEIVEEVFSDEPYENPIEIVSAKPCEALIDDSSEMIVEGMEDIEIPSNDELFAQFVDANIGMNLFSEPQISLMASNSAGRNLEGFNKKAYDKICGVLGQIANGSVSSTVITLTPADMEVIGSYSASDFDINVVMTAVVADCPMELFWFDKTIGYAHSNTPNVTVSNNKSTFSGNYTIKMVVAEEFATADQQLLGKNSAGTEIYAHLEVDPTVLNSLNKAITNAKGIVNNNKAVSDYDKLMNYADAICKLTEYNFAVIQPNYMAQYGYGSPWQLIYVFDDDPSTKVVCEGYAKAMQYLCELTDFTDDIMCSTVWGTADGGSHMWNIIAMENGKNYIFDLTNSDGGSVCNGNKILKGATGNVASGYTCEGMKYIYAVGDLSMTDIYETEQLTISTTNYSVDIGCVHSAVTDKAVAATCTTAGKTAGSHCSKCGVVITAQTPIKALGHSYGAWISSGSTSHYHKCSRCGMQETGSHAWNSGAVTKVAKQVYAGERTYTCTVCKATKKTTYYNNCTVEYRNGTWRFYVNGVFDPTFTGFAKNQNGWWRIQNGVVNFDANGIIYGSLNGQNGDWYVVGGKVQVGLTSIVYIGGTWYRVENGRINYNCNTVEHNDNGWFKLTNGKVDFSFTGLASNHNGTWYCEGAKVLFDKTTVVYTTYNGEVGWWNVVDSKLTPGVTVAYNHNGWWYIDSRGKVDFNFNGLASNHNGTWVIQNGKVNFDYNGSYRYNGRTYTIRGGKVV